MARKKTIEEMSQAGSVEIPPDWVTQFINYFSAGAAHCFLLSGDINGLVFGIPQRQFLQQILAEKRGVVACYDRAKGIYFPDDPLPSSPPEEQAKRGMRQIALECLGTSLAPSSPNPIAAALASTGLGTASPAGDLFSGARRPIDALTLLRRLLVAAKEKVAVLIDYADVLLPPVEKAAMSSDDRLLLVTLLSWAYDKELATSGNMVFLLSKNADDLHADLRTESSGYKALEIPLPTKEERIAFVEWYLDRRDQQKRTIRLLGLTSTELGNLTAGLNLRSVEDLLLLGSKNGGVTRELVKARKDEIISAEYASVAEMIDPLPGGFEALGGMDLLITWSRNELIQPLKEGRRDIPKGVLLVGPPGTGKTYYVQALARELGFNAVALKAENILGGIVGESERKLKLFFSFVRALTPCLVFFDELDQSDMSQRGNGSGNPVASNLFSQFLQFLSNEALRGEVILLFASNRPDLIDQALLRFGRMDAIIPVLLPEASARKSILQAQARRQTVEVDDDALELLVARTDKYSAADLAATLFKCKKLAQREQRSRVQRADAQNALSFIRPATPQIADRYTLLAVQACNDAELLPPPYNELLLNRNELNLRMKEAQQADVEPVSSLRDERTW